MSDAIAFRDNTQSMRPANIPEAMKLSEILAKSSMVPKQYMNKPGDVLVAIIMGNEVDLAPMQSLQGICVINGRPSMYGDLVLAICMRHPAYIDCDEHLENGTAYCTIKRRNRGDTTRTFSEAHAKKAGLWGKAGPWSQYPERMLQLRARSFALRDAFPDALKGIRVAEEEQDVVTTAEPTEPGVRTQAVLSRLAPVEPSPFSAYRSRINEATTVHELQAIAKSYTDVLTDDEKERAREAYRTRRLELFEPVAPYEEKVNQASSNKELADLYTEIEEKVLPGTDKDTLLGHCREMMSQ